MRTTTYIPVFLILIYCTAYSDIYPVGPDKIYKKISDVTGLVKDGDTVYIDAGLYTGDPCVWTPDNLYIYGSGGMARLDAAGKYVQGKGIWVIKGSGNIIENIEFFNASVPDKNGAGIRLDGGSLTIRHCYFHDNEDGILGGNDPESVITVEFSEFANNGYGDGYSHNLYINHAGKLIFRFNYSHNAVVGHCLKSRAHNNYIMYNYFTDGENGNSSRLIDLPNGGRSFIIGNVMVQGKNSENNNLMEYGLEGLTNPETGLYIVNNTMINRRHTGNFINIAPEAKDARVYNNIIGGTGAESDGWLIGEADVSNNLRSNDLSFFRFESAADDDYHLSEGSPAIDYGFDPGKTGEESLLPEYEYKHPEGFVDRKNNGGIDAGAYEYEPVEAVFDNNVVPFTMIISPEPVYGSVSIRIPGIDISLCKINIYDMFGRGVSPVVIGQSAGELLIDTGSLAKGMYIIHIKVHDKYYSGRMIKM